MMSKESHEQGLITRKRTAMLTIILKFKLVFTQVP